MHSSVCARGGGGGGRCWRVWVSALVKCVSVFVCLFVCARFCVLTCADGRSLSLEVLVSSVVGLAHDGPNGFFPSSLCR